jgi:hypothetical protein
MLKTGSSITQLRDTPKNHAGNWYFKALAEKQEILTTLLIILENYFRKLLNRRKKLLCLFKHFKDNNS